MQDTDEAVEVIRKNCNIAKCVIWGAGISTVVFLAEFGVHVRNWCRGEMNRKRFLCETVILAGRALGSFGGSVAGTAFELLICKGVALAGITIRRHVGLLIAIIVGPFGAVAGYALGGKAVEKFVQKHWSGWNENEERKKAECYLEYIITLDTNNIDTLTKLDVERNYRKQVLKYHPDKLEPTATEKEKEDANARVLWLTASKQALLEYMDNPSMLSASCKNEIFRLYETMLEEKK